MTWMRAQLSAREAEALKRRLADRDLDVKPRAYLKKSTAAADRVDWERLGGYELHRRMNSIHLPSAKLPQRAMALMTLNPFDPTEYQPADMEPYVI
jgi:hypothetical protein